MGAARFVRAHTIAVGEQQLSARKVIVATGARPHIPGISGLSETPFMTYETLFDSEQLPARLVVMGAGPLGAEIAQACQRLGSQVHQFGERLLPRDGPEAAEVLANVFTACRRRPLPIC